MKYEAIATKWNILIDYFKENYGVDLGTIMSE